MSDLKLQVKRREETGKNACRRLRQAGEVPAVVYGADRAGDNLFSASIVAVDGHTGEYRWHFQQVHHDIWDYDAPSPVLLFDIEIDGEMRRAVAEPGRAAQGAGHSDRHQQPGEAEDGERGAAAGDHEAIPAAGSPGRSVPGPCAA